MNKLAEIFHDWHSDRWNSLYASSNEPFWPLSDDIAALLKIVAPTLTAQQLKEALKQVEKESGR